MKVFTKQPRDHLDYDIDLSEWLHPDDRVQHIELTVPEGIQVSSSGYSDDYVTLWVKGGTSGEEYKISVLIYTDSREKEVDLLFAVMDI